MLVQNKPLATEPGARLLLRFAGEARYDKGVSR
jgi:hypothetical protein